MEVEEIFENRKIFMPLLLLADEQKNMIEKYLDEGRMFILREKNNLIAVCIVIDAGNKILEIKNLAVDKKFHGKGYGKFFINFLEKNFGKDFEILQVGTVL